MKILRLQANLNNKSDISKNQNDNSNLEITKEKACINKNSLSAISLLRKNTKFRLLRQQVLESIEIFYNNDDVSTISAGKKEFITRNKRRMHKRYLKGPLKVLHKKILSKANIKVSCSFFTKHRPFWVLLPKPSGRETCLCSQHTNIELLIKALYNASIISENNSHELVSHLCCEPRNAKCLLRECISCRDKNINYKEFLNDSNLIYFKWKKATKEVVTKKGLKKNQVVTVKELITTKPLTAIKELETLISPFFVHIHNIEVRYTTMKNLKENLTASEVVIHVDFSENYALKCAE